MVVDRYGEDPLGLLLADDISVEELVDLAWLWKLGEADLFGVCQLLFDDLIAELDAFVADVDTGTRDELA